MQKKKLILTSAATLIIAAIAIGAFDNGRIGTAIKVAGAEISACFANNFDQKASLAKSDSAMGFPNGASCNVALDESTLSSLSEAERKVIDYFSDRIIAEGIVPQPNGSELEKATGVPLVVLAEMKQERLMGGVMAELNHRNFNFDSVMGESYCSKLSACSVDKDLSTASGNELKEYFAEKAEDGGMFAGWQAPDFSLPNTNGERISLSDYRGKPVALVLMAVHCSHCLAILPALSDLQEKYADRDLTILPVYLNAGTASDVKSWTTSLNLQIPILAAGSNALSEAYKSRIVPSIFLIDREGHVTKKLVGYKKNEELDRAFADFVRLN